MRGNTLGALAALSVLAWLPACGPSGKESISFRPYTDEAHEAASAERRPILILFSADW